VLIEEALRRTGHPVPVLQLLGDGNRCELGNPRPSTYSITAYLPGFGFTTGAAVSFQSFTTAGVADNDGVTGTIAVVNGNTATLNVTVPRSAPATPSNT